MSIQSSINQTLGVAAIATKLSPQLQELGEEVRTSSESKRVETQLKKVASKGHIDYDTQHPNDRYTILDDRNAFKYQSLVEKKKMLDTKKRNLGLMPTDWGDFPPRDVITLDEATYSEEAGELQREKVERIKKVRNKMRDSQFGGKNYGNDKQ